LEHAEIVWWQSGIHGLHNCWRERETAKRMRMCCDVLSCSSFLGS
jgi:hypothetical protein